MLKKTIIFFFCMCIFSVYIFGSMIKRISLIEDCHTFLLKELKIFQFSLINSSNCSEKNSENNLENKKLSILSRNYDTEWIKVQKERKTTLRHKCEDLKKENSSFDSLEKLLIPFNRYKLANLLVDEEHKLLYCYIPKIACTPWKKIMMALTGIVTVKEIYSLSSSRVHYYSGLKSLISQEYKDLEVREMLETYKKFMIVRHPTERLLSAYKDKFLSNSPDAKVFKRVYAVPMMRYSRNTSKNIPLTGNGMKFTEFLSYILSQNPQTLQEHWKSYFHLCHPCAMDYDFVGKYETLEADSNQILKNINAPPDLRFPPFKKSKTGEQLKQVINLIPKQLRKKLYNVYKLDFLLFDYVPFPIL